MTACVRPGWSKYFPESHWKSVGVVAVISLVLGIADVILATSVFRDYGWTLFVAMPCALGVATPLLHGIGAPRTFLQCLCAAALSQLALFSGMVIFGIEGVICVAMAAPLWLSCAAIGCCIAYPIHRVMWRGYDPFRGFPVAGLLLLCVIPALTGAEHIAAFDSPQFVLTSKIIIDAPPEIVWRHLVQFPEMQTPNFWMFQMGVAAPVRAELMGRGIGATRYCVFTTGKAKETVTKWNEPRQLAFDVLTTPEPMKEWTFYPDLQPPHLNGYLKSERASFELNPLPNGRTELVGTSWYRNRILPVAYWRLWSDAIIRNVHRAVFEHVKALSEGEMGEKQHPLVWTKSNPGE